METFVERAQEIAYPEPKIPTSEEQGIGITEVAYKNGSFSRAFSNDFDNSLFGN